MAKVVAFSAGRRHGNTEIYIKTALMAMEQMGIEVELIRLNECEILPCKNCSGFPPCLSKGPAGCILKDDSEWLTDKFLESDGYLLGAPVFSLSPAGIVTVFRDRVFGPKMDVAGWEMYGGTPEWAHGRKLYRPGALISVGGALTEHWTSLSMATMYTTTFSAQTNVVDHMNVYQVADPGEALMRQDYLLRARYLGQHLGHAVLNPQIDWCGKYLGPDEGAACPGCHENLMIAKPGRNYVECAICGRRGYIHLDANGNISYDWPADNADRLQILGKYVHMQEIEEHENLIYKPHVEEIQDELKKYKAYEDCIVRPPSKTKKVLQQK